MTPLSRYLDVDNLYVCSSLNILRLFFNNICSVPKNIEQLFIDFRRFNGDNFQFDILAFAETTMYFMAA